MFILIPYRPKEGGPKGSNKFSVNMCPKIYSAYLVYLKAEEKNSMILTRRKKRRKRKLPLKMTVMIPGDDTIPESVSKLNKIIFYDDTDSSSWKFVV